MLKKLIPDKYFPSFFHITADFLKSNNADYILLDIDYTLAPKDVLDMDGKIAAHIQSFLQAGIKIVLVSNNKLERVRRYASTLDLPYVFRAKKPFKGGFRRAMVQIGAEKERTAVIGDQIFTDTLGAHRLGLRCFFVEPVIIRTTGIVGFRRRLEEKYISRGKTI